MSERLQPGAPVIMINDTSRWPVVRISDQHVFQPGAQGGLEPDAYLRQPRTPVPDDTAPEAEWGAEPGLTAAVAAWCAEHGHPMITITFHGPQAPSAAVAATFRTFFSVQPALDSLDRFLETAEPFDEAYVLPFQHGPAHRDSRHRRTGRGS